MSNPTRAFLEAASDWSLEHKTEEQMLDLTSTLQAAHRTEHHSDDYGVKSIRIDVEAQRVGVATVSTGSRS